MKVDGDLFRAVITTEFAKGHVLAGEVRTRVEGPYSTIGPAKSRVTEARNRAKNYGYDRVVEGRVEKAVVTWEEVQ